MKVRAYQIFFKVVKMLAIIFQLLFLKLCKFFQIGKDILYFFISRVDIFAKHAIIIIKNK